MKNAILMVAVSLFASASFAQNSKIVECSNKENSVQLKILGNEVVAYLIPSQMEYSDLEPYGSEQGNGITRYSILVEEIFDMNTWFDIFLKDGEIVKRQVYVNGDDTDTYQGSVTAEGDAAFVCTKKY